MSTTYNSTDVMYDPENSEMDISEIVKANIAATPTVVAVKPKVNMVKGSKFCSSMSLLESKLAQTDKCPHGENCCYAHSDEEFNPKPCRGCKAPDSCWFKHACESKRAYIDRIGYENLLNMSKAKQTKKVARPAEPREKRFAPVIRFPATAISAADLKNIPLERAFDIFEGLVYSGTTDIRIVIAGEPRMRTHMDYVPASRALRMFDDLVSSDFTDIRIQIIDKVPEMRSEFMETFKDR